MENEFFSTKILHFGLESAPRRVAAQGFGRQLAVWGLEFGEGVGFPEAVVGVGVDIFDAV